jgi:hypothetical protein
LQDVEIEVELRLWVVVVGLPRLSPPSSQTWQDVEREVAQLLEPTETPHVAVSPLLVLELQLRVAVAGLPPFSPPSSRTWQDVKREVAQLLELTETPHVAVGPVLIC